MQRDWLFLKVVVLLIILIIITACSNDRDQKDGGNGSKSHEAKEQEQVLHLLDSTSLPTMDTTRGTDSSSFTAMNQVFEGLYRLGPDSKPVPGVAKGVIESEDGKVLTFNLNEEALWSDGSPVTAHDFVYAWRKALHPNTISPYASIMEPIKNAKEILTLGNPLYGLVEELGVKAIDEHTLEVTLENPVPYFIGLTAFPTFFPQKQEFVEAQAGDYALYVDKMLYNGPFKMTEWDASGWTFSKNEHYWDKDDVKLTQINFKVIKDTASEINLYETGQIDRASVSTDLVEQYIDNPELITYSEPTMWYLKFNMDRIPLNQRKAIQRAINKTDFVNVLLNNGSVAADYFVPAGFASHPEKGEDFRVKHGNIVSYDVKEAQRYWKEALADAETNTITWELLINDRDEMKLIGEYIKYQLETNLPGLFVDINVQPFKQRLALDDAKEYDIQLSGWGPDYPDPLTFLDLWITDGGNNNTNYSNYEYDEIIHDAFNTIEALGERFEKLQDAEVILLEQDAVLVPLFQRGRAVLQKPYVKNLVVHPFGPSYSYKWAYIETK